MAGESMEVILARPIPETTAYFRNDWPIRVAPRWAGRGLAGEIGTRAYRYLQMEERRVEGLGLWPPGLEDYEELVECT